VLSVPPENHDAPAPVAPLAKAASLLAAIRVPVAS
jgi:hypothetical protein